LWEAKDQKFFLILAKIKGQCFINCPSTYEFSFIFQKVNPEEKEPLTFILRRATLYPTDQKNIRYLRKGSTSRAFVFSKLRSLVRGEIFPRTS